jgi:peptidoglycan/xylan/chitin deacetylase (PgdA/CDA1 family)
MIKKIFWIFFAVIGMVMFVHVGGAYAETSDAVSTGNVGDAIDSIEMSGSIVQLESISFSTTDINLKIGESIDAKTAIIYSPIDTMDNPPLVWTSNDANIAQVDGTGNIIGVSPGTAVINASAGSIATSVIVNVTSLADIPVGNTSATDSTLLPTTIASPADPVTETAPTDTTTNTPPADPVTETAPTDTTTNTPPADPVTETAPTDTTTNTPPADPVTETAPTDTTTNTPPADPVTETAPTDTTTNTPPADLVTETAPTDTTTNTPPADPVTETAPIDSITGTLPVDTATEMPPADNIPDTSIVDSAAEVLPEENPLQVQTDTDSLVLDAQNPDSLSAAVILESETNAQLLFVFDDSRKTDITIAAPVLAASGFSGTAYVMTDPFWATVGFMTNADLEALYSDYGWDLGNHSLNHLDITDLNNQENMDTLVQEYLINQENLIANGWTRGAYHVAYANDVYNEELVQLLMQMGVLTARTFGTDTLMPTPIQDYYRLSIVDILSGLAAVKSQIDEAIRTNATIMLVTHGIADTAFGDKVSLSDFQTIVNYVSQYAGLGQLEVKTISQWYTDMTALDPTVPLQAITLDTTNFELLKGASKTLSSELQSYGHNR